MSLGENSGVTRIVFDLYQSCSIKEPERRKRAKDGYINIGISSWSQKLNQTNTGTQVRTRCGASKHLSDGF